MTVFASFGFSEAVPQEVHGQTVMATSPSLSCPRRAIPIGRSENYFAFESEWKRQLEEIVGLHVSLEPLCRAPMRIRKCEVLEFVCGDADPSFKPDVLAHTQARIGEPPIRRAERRRLRRALISRLTATVNMLLDCPCHARSSSPAHPVESARRW